MSSRTPHVWRERPFWPEHAFGPMRRRHLHGARRAICGGRRRGSASVVTTASAGKVWGRTSSGFNANGTYIVGAISVVEGFQYAEEYSATTGQLIASTVLCTTYSSNKDNHNVPDLGKTGLASWAMCCSNHNAVAQISIKRAAGPNPTIAALAAATELVKSGLSGLVTYPRFIDPADNGREHIKWRRDQLAWCFLYSDNDWVSASEANHPFWDDVEQCYVEIAKIGTNLYFCTAAHNPTSPNPLNIYSFTVNTADGYIRNAAGTAIANFINPALAGGVASATPANADVFYTPPTGMSCNQGDFSSDGTWTIIRVLTDDVSMSYLVVGEWNGTGSKNDPTKWTFTTLCDLGYGVASGDDIPFSNVTSAGKINDSKRIWINQLRFGINHVSIIEKVGSVWRYSLAIDQTRQVIDHLEGSPWCVPGTSDQVPVLYGSSDFTKYDNISKPVTGAANNGSGLIRLTFSAGHGFNSNRIAVAGVTGTTEANGTWQINIIDANNVDLIGSAFVNAYVSGGFGSTATVKAVVVTPGKGAPVYIGATALNQAVTINSQTSFTVDEYSDAVVTLQADRPCGFTITGNGADDAKFEIVGGVKLCMPAQNADAPADADAGNTYDVEVVAYSMLTGQASAPFTLRFNVAALTKTGGTNLFTSPTNMTGGVNWALAAINGTGTHNPAFTDPAGTQLADRFADSTANAAHSIQQSRTMAANTRHTITVAVAKTGASNVINFVAIRSLQGGTNNVNGIASGIFDMVRGRFVGPLNATVPITLESFGCVALANGWWLITITFTTLGTTASAGHGFLQKQFSGPTGTEVGITAANCNYYKPMQNTGKYKTAA